MSDPLVRYKRSNTASPLRRGSPAMRRDPSSLRKSVIGGEGNSAPVSRASTPSSSSRDGGSANLSGLASSSSGSTDSGSYTEFNLRSCTAEEVKDVRHHIIKFHSRTAVNPATQFTPPIRFHRKDPRNLQMQLTLSELEDRKRDQESGHNSESGGINVAAAGGVELDESKRPKVDMSVVAPDGNARKQRNPFQKKTRQVARGTDSSRKLRYEEYYPWVMEDFDGKNTWVGSYEAAQSDTYALFVFDGDGFKMVPAEKWYKLTPRNKFATLSAEEVEERMEKRNNVPRWIMKHINEEQATNNNGKVNQRRKFRTVDSDSTRAESSSRASLADRDDDDLDFDEEFADDEEAPIMDGDEEEVKEVEEKIKKEMRAANYLGPAEDDADDVEDTEESKIDKEGRKLKKYLRSLERNTYYASDDEDENPYISEKESSDEEMNDVPIKAEENGGGAKNSSPLPHVKVEPLALPVYKPFVKKEFKNLPPGLSILQLPPHTLSQFARGLWNPNVQSSAQNYDNGGADIKRVKVERSNSPAGGDSLLLNEEDVRSILTKKPVTAKELLNSLKSRLKSHPDNPTRLRQLVKKVAKLQDGVLVLKD